MISGFEPYVRMPGERAASFERLLDRQIGDKLIMLYDDRKWNKTHPYSVIVAQHSRGPVIICRFATKEEALQCYNNDALVLLF